MAQVDEHLVHLTGPGGSHADIAILGATVTSFIPEDGEERLFRSSKSHLAGPKAIRGGIPVVWPAFGPPPKQPPFDKLVQHGLARTSKWTVENGSDPAVAVFTLQPNDDIKRVYTPDFRLKYTVALTAGDVLETALEVKNPSSTESLSFQALFHNYFRLPEGTLPGDVTVDDALTGLTYKDKVLNHAEDTEKRKSFTFVDETDRVYSKAPKSVVARYGKSQQGIKVETENLGELVTWNPGESKAATIADMHDGGWKQFVCLEPGHVGDFYSLPPNETWTGKQRITALSARLSVPANNASL